MKTYIEEEPNALLLTIHRIRQAIREQRYRISSHANEEMSEDELEAKDIESIILTGKVVQKFTREPPRYPL